MSRADELSTPRPCKRCGIHIVLAKVLRPWVAVDSDVADDLVRLPSGLLVFKPYRDEPHRCDPSYVLDDDDDDGEDEP